MDTVQPTILVSESAGFPAGAAAILREIGVVRLEDLDRRGLLREGRGADVLWVRLRHRIDEALMAACPGVRIVATPTTGLTHVDLAGAERRGIRIVSLRGETAFLNGVFATAEHTLGLMLALTRHLPEAARHVTSGGWNRDLFRGTELRGKTVGIVGFGRLGRMVAQLLRAFGVRTLAADPHRLPAELPDDVELIPTARLLADADIVTLHLSLDDTTRRCFGATELAMMKRGAWLVNTARGELVDEMALLAALEAGRLGGAALDVLADETSDGMGSHPLVAYARTHENLLITPHIGGCTVESMDKTEVFLAERLKAAMLAVPEWRTPSSTTPGQRRGAAEVPEV